MKKKVAVVCGAGLGDALIMMIASHAFQEAGYEVCTFTRHLSSFGKWFEGFKFYLPDHPDRWEEALTGYDTVVLQHENSLRAQTICSLHQKGVIKRLIVFYNNYRYEKHGPLRPESDFAFNESESMAKNVSLAIQKIFSLSTPSKEIGLKIPAGLVHKKHPKRVVIHPTSSSPKKNWFPRKFLKLSRKLQSLGYQVVFAVSTNERPDWLFVEKEGIGLPLLSRLEDLAHLLYESGHFVGNDSGPGHLASYLQIPSVILAIFRQSISHWRPDWLPSTVLLPPKWAPNLKGLRLREQKWQYFISVRKVLRSLLANTQEDRPAGTEAPCKGLPMCSDESP